MFLRAFWLEFEPYLAEQVVSNITPIIEKNLPGFIDNVVFEEFTLGSKPFFIEAVKGYKKFETDVVVNLEL